MLFQVVSVNLSIVKNQVVAVDVEDADVTAPVLAVAAVMGAEEMTAIVIVTVVATALIPVTVVVTAAVTIPVIVAVMMIVTAIANAVVIAPTLATVAVTTLLSVMNAPRLVVKNPRAASALPILVDLVIKTTLHKIISFIRRGKIIPSKSIHHIKFIRNQICLKSCFIIDEIISVYFCFLPMYLRNRFKGIQSKWIIS